MNNSKVNHITLSELAGHIKQTLDENLEISYWIRAEIAEFKVNAFSGHCYLELVEKDDLSNTIKARMRGNIWANSFKMLKLFFENSTGMALGAGLKVLIRGTIEYHETFGISFNIRDIDPAYTVGELAIKIQQTIDLLTKDGVIDMNKELEMPLIPKSIALITSQNAAGYQDFTNQLGSNKGNYKFSIKLFEAVMQGDKAPDSIMLALNQIFDYLDYFDAVIILRGGGAVLDLSCFNDYNLCYMAAQFPIPIITAIGHDKDESVLDIIANTKLKTPTAAAEYILAQFSEFEANLAQISENIFDIIHNKINSEKNHLTLLSSNLKPLVNRKIEQNRFHLIQQFQHITASTKQVLGANTSDIKRIGQTLKKASNRYITQHKANLEENIHTLKYSTEQFLSEAQKILDNTQLKIDYQNPTRILEKGYSITTKNGKLVRSTKDLSKGDTIETLFKDGKKSSSVN